MRPVRVFALLAGVLALAACDANDFGDPPKPMGNFNLGHNVTVGHLAQTVPISRQVTAEEWEVEMEAAIEERFGLYEGTKNFDIGISIDGYVLAPPGVPLVASPRSALIITVNVWDNAAQELLNPGGKMLTVIEGTSEKTLLGSGWTQNKRQQMKKLARNAAKAVQEYILANPEWVGLPPKEGSAGETAAEGDAKATPAASAPATSG